MSIWCIRSMGNLDVSVGRIFPTRSTRGLEILISFFIRTNTDPLQCGKLHDSKDFPTLITFEGAKGTTFVLSAMPYHPRWPPARRRSHVGCWIYDPID